MNIEKLFFELLQIAIGTRKSLSAMPTSKEWALLFELSKKQALTAIAFAGITKLNTASDYGASLGIPEMVYLKWLGLVAKTQQRNRELNEACASLCKDLAHEGLYACILKGQSNLVNYPKELRECRTPGDIDVWCGLMDPEGIDIAVADLDGNGAHYEKYFGERGVIEWVLADWRMKNQNQGDSSIKGPDPAVEKRGETKEILLPEVNYHHIDWEYKGIECEVHFKPSWLNNPLHNARLQRWCRENEQWQTLSFSPLDSTGSPQVPGEGVFNVPTVEFNAVYQLVHIYRHLFNEGIGLRQLLDYYFVLKTLSISPLKGEEFADASNRQTMGMWDDPSASSGTVGISVKSKEEIMHTLGRFGMKPFTSAVMYVLQKVFEAPLNPPEGGRLENADWQTRWPWMLCAPDAKRGEFLLNEIMLAGNFGKYDSRNVITANEGYLRRFVRRQKRFLRFLTQYPSEVVWGPYFSVKQRAWRMWHGWR